MIEVKLGDIEVGAEALKKLADNPKLPTTLYIRAANAFRDVREQLEILAKGQELALAGASEFIAGPTGEKKQQFIDLEHKSSYFKSMADLRESTVTLPKARKIAWKDWQEAKVENFLPSDLSVLMWLIEVPEEAE